PCLRIGFLAAKLKNGVAEQGMRVGIFWIELDSFTKLDDCRFRKMRDGVRAPKQDVKGSGISHGFLQVLKPLLGVSQTLGLEVGNAEKVRTLKICLECNGGLQIAHSGVKISAVEVDSPKHILRARVTRIIRCDCLRKLACFLDITSTKPCHGGIHGNVRIAGSKFHSLIQLTGCLVKTVFGEGKIRELPQAEGDHLVVVALRF